MKQQMAITPIGNSSVAFVEAEIARLLSRDLTALTERPGDASGVRPAATRPNDQTLVQTTHAVEQQGLIAAPTAVAVTAVPDVAAALVHEVAANDLAKLSQILSPGSSPYVAPVLDSLLDNAVHAIESGHSQRAVGYLADLATRSPERAETLASLPQLEPVRENIHTLVGQMTTVARMSAETGLAVAEHSVSMAPAKPEMWDTSSEVLLRLANKLYDAGGYANYVRTTELARIVAGIPEFGRPQALAVSASSAAGLGQAIPLMAQGLTVPYYTTEPALPVQPTNKSAQTEKRGARMGGTPLEDALENWREVKAIAGQAVRQLWERAPLLVLLITWFTLGLSGGVTFAIGSRIWPDGIVDTLGGWLFPVWAVGFLALVGLGFYARVRRVRWSTRTSSREGPVGRHTV